MKKADPKPTAPAPVAGWRERAAARDSALRAAREDHDAEVAQLQKALANERAAHEDRLAAIERAHDELAAEAEAEVLGAFGAALDPIVARMVEEPTHADTRALLAAYRTAHEGYMRAVGRDVGARPITLALLRCVRADDVLAFAVDAPYLDGENRFPTLEGWLETALRRDDVPAVREHFSALEAAVRHAKGAPPNADRVEERREQWAMRQRTSNRERIAAAGAGHRAAAQAAAALEAGKRPACGENYNANGTRTRWGTIIGGGSPSAMPG